MFKNVSKRYKIFIISVSCVLLALAIVLITLFYTTQNNIKNYLSLDVLHLPQENKIDLDSSSDYLGQPDMVRTKTGKYIVVYPEGHGHGSLIMQTSMDGKNFTKQECPESWKNSQEVPTIYTLDRIDGSQYIILISGKPYWVADNLKADGFQYSLSKDDGEIWSEFTTVYSPMDCIVAMSSLTQLKENGEFVDKWMGTFHTHKFVNYKTILSFDENDDVVWSEPEPILSEYREIEKKNKLCEIEIIRAHNDTLIMLTRNEARGGKTSMISYSNDEGESWTKPVYLPYDLSGDRFSAIYDETNDKVLISFRQIIPHKPNALSMTKFMTYGWVLWIGNMDDLLSYNQGETIGDCLIVLGEDSSGDCGYSGLVDENGNITAVSYGHFLSSDKSNIMLTNFRVEDFI